MMLRNFCRAFSLAIVLLLNKVSAAPVLQEEEPTVILTKNVDWHGTGTAHTTTTPQQQASKKLEDACCAAIMLEDAGGSLNGEGTYALPKQW